MRIVYTKRFDNRNSFVRAQNLGGLTEDMSEILSLAQKEAAYLQKVRRSLHQIPELSNEEWKTSDYIKKELDSMGIPYDEGVAGTGVVGYLRGNNPDGKVLLIRADMDALPIEEINDCDFKSQHPGVMHACGHDAHITCLLGAAKILSQKKDSFSGTIKLCFQPAEEGSDGGAELMVKEGVLKNPDVDFAISMHVEPSLRVGTASIEAGPITAYPERFSFDFYGVGGHGTLNCECKDPLLPAIEACNMIQNVRSKISALDPCIIQICMINGGTATNVIPETCSVKGTCRTFTKEVRDKVRGYFKNIACHISEIWDVKCDYTYGGHCFPVINDPFFTHKVREDLKDIFEDGYASIKDMGGEDYCFFSEQVPSVYMQIGSSNENSATQNPLHNPNFQIDEGVLVKGTAAFAKIALSYLNGQYDF